MAISSDKKNVLTISPACSLHGTPIDGTIDREWSTKISPTTRSRFNNVGFDFRLEDPANSIRDMRQTLHDTHWDGVMVGWCIHRMSVDRTEVFEAVMREVMDAGRRQPDLRAMFCRGPSDLVEATLRTFPVE